MPQGANRLTIPDPAGHVDVKQHVTKWRIKKGQLIIKCKLSTTRSRLQLTVYFVLHRQHKMFWFVCSECSIGPDCLTKCKVLIPQFSVDNQSVENFIGLVGWNWIFKLLKVLWHKLLLEAVCHLSSVWLLGDVLDLFWSYFWLLQVRKASHIIVSCLSECDRNHQVEEQRWKSDRD